MRHMKKTLSLTLALVMALAMAVPSFAAGATETVVLDHEGITVTLTNVLRTETHPYKFEVDGGYQVRDLTIYVVGDEGSTINVVASTAWAATNSTPRAP